MTRNSLVDVHGQVIHETDLAYLFDDGRAEPVWIPKELAQWNVDDKVMTVPYGVAFQKGLL